MQRNKKNKAGFTLVELMVVAVIVAILAAVAIPLMSANKKRAIMTEAEAGLGTIRSTLRAQYAETGAYDEDINGDPINNGAPATDLQGIGDEDLDGRWWSQECYEITTVGPSNYVLTATGDDSTTDESDDVAGLIVTLDQDGDFDRTIP